MANKQKFFIISLFLLFSCQSLYYPGTNNISLITSKYQGITNIDIGTNGFLFQNAFSPLPNFSTQANFIYLNRKRNNNVYGTKYGEIGLGYYNKVDKYDYEIYGGYGRGINLLQGDTTKFRKFYLQPNIGWQNKCFTLGFSPKLSLIKFVNISNFSPAFEPSFLYSMGYEHIFFNSQIGFSFIPFSSAMNMKSLYFSISLGFTFKF